MKKSYIENIRKYVKDKGYVPTSDIIKEAINVVCPDGGNILENKTAIIDEVIRLMTIGQQSKISSNSELKNDVQHIIHCQESELSHQDESTNLDANTLTQVPTDLNLIERVEVENQVIESEEEAETGIVVSEGEKHDLITSQSSVLDVQLSELETIELCSQIPDVFDDYKSFVGEVTNAIKAFVDDKFDHQETNTVDDSISELRQHIANRQARLDTKFAQGLNEVKGDLEQIRSNIKSRQSAILDRFRIPAKT